MAQENEMSGVVIPTQIDSTSAEPTAQKSTGNAAWVTIIPSSASGMTLTQTAVTVTASSQTLIAANTARKFLSWMVVGTVNVTISPATPVVSGIGFVYNAGGAVSQGGAEAFTGAQAQNAFYVIAASAGSIVYVWEGA